MKGLVFAFFIRKNGNVLTRIKILMYKMAHIKTKQTKNCKIALKCPIFCLAAMKKIK